MPTRKRTHKQQSAAPARSWHRMDLHLHTPASVDYREANVSYLSFLKKADERGLDIVAFTDHNTAVGYERYLNQVQELELLERLGRLTDTERSALAEYRRLQEKLLILPGFELTATLGFHILAIFPPETTVRELEHLLLNLRVPADKLDLGSGEVGATSDVLTAYRLIDEAGGLVIAAHANSSHGVAMPGFDFGGQTRISYTQDPHLHALEVTDLTSKSRRRTALFFSGTKPEYPRRMQLIQSSDAHRLTGIPGNNQELGIADRATEILLDDLSFDAIKDVFLGNDFARLRPYVPTEVVPYDPILDAREEGETLVQAFHEHLVRGQGVERKILQDVVALSNTNGGTIYIGLSANPRSQVLGVQRPADAIRQLKTEMARHIVPPLEAQLDTHKIGNKSILRIIVPRGSEVPYCIDATQIYIRSENETSLAVRDEIVNLVRDALAVEFAARPEPAERPMEEPAPVKPAPVEAPPLHLPAPLPRTGVEVIPGESHKGQTQYSVRDLRNNRIIHNVTRSSARKLWQYAITQFEEHPVKPAEVKWQGDLGLSNAHRRAGKVRFDLLQRDSAGELHLYYGVTEDGIHGPWKALIESEAIEPIEQLEEAETTEEQMPVIGELPPEMDELERAEQIPAVGELPAELIDKPAESTTWWEPVPPREVWEATEGLPVDVDYDGRAEPITQEGFIIEEPVPSPQDSGRDHNPPAASLEFSPERATMEGHRPSAEPTQTVSPENALTEPAPAALVVPPDTTGAGAPETERTPAGPESEPAHPPPAEADMQDHSSSE